jgi:hypothetical protein
MDLVTSVVDDWDSRSANAKGDIQLTQALMSFQA